VAHTDGTHDTYDLEYLERQVNILTRLVDINSIINSTLDMARLLTIIMEMIKDIMRTEASTLLLYEEKNDDLVFKVALGEAGRELQERYRVKVGQGIAGWVAERRTTVNIPDAYADERFDPNFDLRTGFKTRSMLCSPLLFKGRLLGVIQAINPVNRDGFDDHDISLFNAFAAQCALAVQNAIFFGNALEEERIRQELAAARAIQDSILPPISERFGGIAVAARSIAAREVGGEFYDIVRFEEENAVGVVLGDVHLKGIPGAIFASSANGAVKALAGIIMTGPSVLLSHVQNTFREHFAGGGRLSLFYGVYDGSKDSLVFSNTGMAYPILVRKGVARYLRFGRSEEAPERSVRVTLIPGDLFVVLTDGVLKVKNRTGQLMGLNRVMKCLQEEYASPEEAIDALLDQMKQYAGGLEQREDVTIIAIKVLAP
jgi:phosphoserine phosphatase RsbU/P